MVRQEQLNQNKFFNFDIEHSLRSILVDNNRSDSTRKGINLRKVYTILQGKERFVICVENVVCT